MKRFNFLTIILLFSLACTLSALEFPTPAKDLLQTDFTSSLESPFLKTPLVTRGYILMDGKERFLYKQTEPILLEIRKNGERVTYKNGDSKPVNISGAFGANNYMMLFFSGDTEELERLFEITVENRADRVYYRIVPKKRMKIAMIEVLSFEDKIASMIITFSDRSTNTFKFTNTVTGIKPDEKLF